jgi:hypothetical protein
LALTPDIPVVTIRFQHSILLRRFSFYHAASSVKTRDQSKVDAAIPEGIFRPYESHHYEGICVASPKGVHIPATIHRAS